MTASKSELYRNIAEQLGALLAGELDRIANAANMAALIYYGLPDVKWTGWFSEISHTGLTKSGSRLMRSESSKSGFCTGVRRYSRIH